MTLLFLPVWLAFALFSPAEAQCGCYCVDGVVQAVCTNTTDVEPVCHPRVCPVQSPSIAPIQVPEVPQPNASYCRQHYVYDELTAQYEWRQLCE